MLYDYKMNLVVVPVSFLVAMLMLGTVVADDVPGWTQGAEKDIFDHTFDEDSWYTTVEHVTEDNDTAEFGVSYLNMGDIEAFLITLNQVTDPEGGVGVLPYQMFGMHYYTKEGNEVFLGALLAFLCIYNDTNNNGIPSPGEDLFYVIPFGVGDWLNDGNYTPTVTNMQVVKVGEDHYKMGITYKNLYAIASQNPLATALLKTGWVFKFSEFSVTYDIKLDRETGTLSTETFYTIGQVTDLWAVILGIPIPIDNIHSRLPDNFGVGAVHFTTIFTSEYRVVENSTGSQLTGNIDREVKGQVNVESGSDRAFSIGFRGDFDTINEDNDTVLKNDRSARNVILTPNANDLLLVAWQLGFSANVFVSMAYGLSGYVRDQFASPNTMVGSSTRDLNADGFGKQAFWYGVFFPSWDGYRVVHDPVYTAFFGEEGSSSGGAAASSGMGAGMAVLAAAPVVILVAIYRKRSGCG